MRRRTFLSSAGTIGIVGAVSSTTLVSSAYSSLSTSASLKAFSPESRTVLDHFISQMSQNIQDLGLDKDLISRFCLPVQVIEKSSDKKDHRIVYKNKFGEFITLNLKDGKETIHISG